MVLPSLNFLIVYSLFNDFFLVASSLMQFYQKIREVAFCIPFLFILDTLSLFCISRTVINYICALINIVLEVLWTICYFNMTLLYFSGGPTHFLILMITYIIIVLEQSKDNPLCIHWFNGNFHILVEDWVKIFFERVN
jgi:hypothetical protein